MSSTTSYRLSGIALLMGSALSAIGYILSVFASGNDLQSLISPLSLIFSLMTLLGSMLVLLGLPGMYTRQARRAGILGLLGFLLVFQYRTYHLRAVDRLPGPRSSRRPGGLAWTGQSLVVLAALSQRTAGPTLD